MSLRVRTFQAATRQDRLRLSRGDRRPVDVACAPLQRFLLLPKFGALWFPSFNWGGSRRLCPRNFIKRAARRRAAALEVLPRSDKLLISLKFVAVKFFYSGRSANPAANLKLEEHGTGCTGLQLTSSRLDDGGSNLT